MDGVDRLYISTLFTWQQRQVGQLAAQFRPHTDVQIGGPGVLPLPTALSPEVDAMPNDYTLFGIDFGIGYSSRGCIRSCEFCPVPKTEGKPVREASTIGDLLNPRSKRLVLMDNNFFASDWRPKITEIRDRGLHVAWSQGLDIRLIDQEQAAVLGDLRRRGQVWNQRFTRSGRLHFAWDNPTPGHEIERGIRVLFDVGFKPDDLTFYVLIGFRSTVEEEVSRLDRLHSLGIAPKVMVYRDESERDTRDPVRMDIQHWNDGFVWRKVPFRDYDRRLAS